MTEKENTQDCECNEESCDTCNPKQESENCCDEDGCPICR